jgi:hypothetical protein
MSTITVLGRRIRTTTRRRAAERTVIDLHPAVRDEVLTRWEIEAR